MPALLLLSGPAAGLRREVTSEVILGRSPSCDIPLEDSKVSRRHARITLTDGAYFLEDLGSTNGTFINRGKRLMPGTRQPLSDGDEIIVGKTFLRFQIVK